MFLKSPQEEDAARGVSAASLAAQRAAPPQCAEPPVQALLRGEASRSDCPGDSHADKGSLLSACNNSILSSKLYQTSVTSLRQAHPCMQACNPTSSALDAAKIHYRKAPNEEPDSWVSIKMVMSRFQKWHAPGTQSVCACAHETTSRSLSFSLSRTLLSRPLQGKNAVPFWLFQSVCSSKPLRTRDTSTTSKLHLLTHSLSLSLPICSQLASHQQSQAHVRRGLQHAFAQQSDTTFHRHSQHRRLRLEALRLEALTHTHTHTHTERERETAQSGKNTPSTLHRNPPADVFFSPTQPFIITVDANKLRLEAHKHRHAHTRSQKHSPRCSSDETPAAPFRSLCAETASGDLF